MTGISQGNLFSVTSKFHVNIRQSRCRLCCIYLCCVIFVIVIIANISIYKNAELYQIILGCIVCSIIFIGIYNSGGSNRNLLCSFMLTSDGGISFSNEHSSYQLLASSRFSFFGCWLVMKPIIEGNRFTKIDDPNYIIKKYFIYRDSLNGQDFSRLVKVLNSLH